MKIGIMTIGDELTSGRIQDTNSSYIALQVNMRGWRISSMLSVGDDEESIRRGLHFTLSLSDAAVITGGLGPTADDMTTQAIANIYGLPLYTDEEILSEIKTRFERLRIEWTQNNAKQAMFPEGARPIFNPTGTAWGFSLRAGGKIIAVIPGVPSEVKRMFPEGVMPLLEKECRGRAQYVVSRTVKIFGLAEAKIDQTVSSIDLALPGISIGFYPRFPENHLVITSRNESREEAVRNLRTAQDRIVGALHKNIFGYDEETIEGIVASLLAKKGLSLAVAESVTGGLIADRLTNIPGSSAFLNRGIVAYSNEAKTDLLGVPPDILETYGAVSEQTAILMAEGVRKLAKTDIGLSTTGIAGPTGGSEAKPVGTVFIALSDGGDAQCRKFFFRWERRRIKEITSQWAIEMLRRFLTGN
ncbi:MAG: competence/damage-inducible protein A [Syntrophales bacterium]